MVSVVFLHCGSLICGPILLSDSYVWVAHEPVRAKTEAALSSLPGVCATHVENLQSSHRVCACPCANQVCPVIGV